MLKLHSSLNTVEIHNMKNMLESSGIQCEVRGEHLKSGMGEIPFSECWTELWILDDRMKEEAERLIEGKEGAQRGSWNCPKCGESVDGEFDQCWSCEGYRP